MKRNVSFICNIFKYIKHFFLFFLLRFAKKIKERGMRIIKTCRIFAQMRFRNKK